MQLDIVAKHDGVDALCGNVAEMDDIVDAPRSSEGPRVTVLDLSAFAIRNRVATSTVLARRQAILDVGGFDVAFRGPEDYDLWMRLAASISMPMLRQVTVGRAHSTCRRRRRPI